MFSLVSSECPSRSRRPFGDGSRRAEARPSAFEKPIVPSSLARFDIAFDDRPIFLENRSSGEPFGQPPRGLGRLRQDQDARDRPIEALRHAENRPARVVGTKSKSNPLFDRILSATSLRGQARRLVDDDQMLVLKKNPIGRRIHRRVVRNECAEAERPVGPGPEPRSRRARLGNPDF